MTSHTDQPAAGTLARHAAPSGAAFHETVQAAVRADHASLADLIERASQICLQSQESDCHASGCAAETIQICGQQCIDLAETMLKLMLDHFEREDQLMRMLPRTETASRHCDNHRLAHIDFSSRYNRLLAENRQDCPSLRIRVLQAFLHGWIADHALAFDDELTRQLRAAALV